MSTVEKWRPRQEAYKPPGLPPKPPVPVSERTTETPPTQSKKWIPPSAPSPPNQSSRTSPPRPASRRSAQSPPPRREATPQNTQQLRANQWFFTHSEAVSTLSVIDGLSPQEERLRRAKGVNFIYQAGILLDLPQFTLWVAGVFFHRFYMRYSMVEAKKGVHHYNIAAAALFLANKTEENCRKTKDLIVAVAKVAQKNAKLIIDEQSKEYWRWRDSILNYEELMLEALTFDLMVEHPYQRLYTQLGRLDLQHDKKLRDAAWSFCNDSCLTILPLLMDAREIAVSAIFFASASTGIKINDVNGRPWWEALGGDPDKMTKSAKIMVEFIKENPLQKKQQPLTPGSPVFNLESTRRTGESIESIIYSQTDDGYASQNGTPMLTAGSENRSGVSQSPSKTATEPGARVPDASGQAGADPSQPGDSDAGLKAAANDLDAHRGVPNGRGVPSPDGKRKAMVDDIDAEGDGRGSKRARTEEGDAARD